MTKLQLGKGLIFENLYNPKDLQNLDKKFLFYLREIDESLYQYLIAQREKYPSFSEKYGDEDTHLIECAKILEVFISEIFNIKQDLAKLHQKFFDSSKTFEFKRLFVNKKIKLVDISQYTFEDFNNIKQDLFSLLNITEFNENVYIEKVIDWLKSEKEYNKEIKLATIFGAFLFFERNLYDSFGKPNIFFKAKKTDFNKLIEVKKVQNSSYLEIFKDDNSEFIKRDNFNLYLETSIEKSLHNSNYCVKCHKREKDHCRVGDYSITNSSYIPNPLNKELTGCPLSMNISQMHLLNEIANPIAALAVATINNPLLAATGANICNDCTVSCIFQKQETVDTPLVETETLKQVLELPFGFEIYSLLSRWNPLRFYRPFTKEANNKNILIVGLGPAGYSLSYNMSQEGYGVVAIDALKLEPLNIEFKPIVDYKEIKENLDNRIIQGFGGVSEYGITSRWDKNYLKVLRIIIQRNNLIKLYGGIRFGSNITFADLEDLGFSHVALCTGAGTPNITNIENSMIKGMKTSSEFLMSLNLGAYKEDNFFNMEIRLPIVVLGGGLTALDCATEAILYYKRQVEKIIEKYNSLDKNFVENFLNTEDKEVLKEYIEHYKLFQAGRSVIDGVNDFGGVKIVYHKKFEESRSYKENAEELNKTLKQGVSFIEEAVLVKINKDINSNLSSMDFKVNGKLVNIPAKTLILAIGTNPNNILQEEYKDIFSQEGVALKPLNVNKLSFKNQDLSVILQKIPTEKGDIAISILGDTHKTFNGSVVKALASSFYGQYAIMDSMKENNIQQKFQGLVKNFENMVLSQIISIKTLNKRFYEINIKSKLMSEKFQAGQFFKIQNFENFATTINNIKLYSEPIMVTGMSVDKNNHILKCIVLKTGASTAIIENILPQEPILFMGPLGYPTKIPLNKKIMVIGGGVANATTLSIAQQAQLNNCEVIYVGGYKNKEDIFYLDLIKNSTFAGFLSIEDLSDNFSEDNIEYVKGNILEALLKVKKSSLSNNIDIIFIAGSCDMMSSVGSYLKDNFKAPAIASLNSPMNCGLKGVCSSCLQQKKDGSFIYSCSQQDLPIIDVNFSHLKSRLEQNSLTEKISYLFYQNIITH